ncbi:MAG: hypothetical protein QS748_05120, partial [Candidatus Endonucleobacter bathymodioli]|nr:hypothetical protein [Candidatus Endonucleobacter bathymodioli]
LNSSKKDMRNLPFNSSSRREASLDINLKKRQIQADINRFNEKAQDAGNTHITLDMRTIEMGLLNQGNQFLENNKALEPFLQ